MDAPYLNFPSGSQTSGNGCAQTTQSVNQDFCDPFPLHGPGPNYFPEASQNSYTLFVHDSGSSQVPQNRGTNSSQSLYPSRGSQSVTTSSRSSHPYHQAKLCHLADRAYSRHCEWSQPPSSAIPALSPSSNTATPYTYSSNWYYNVNQEYLEARKLARGSPLGPGSQSNNVALNTSQSVPLFMDSFTLPGQLFPSAPLPRSPADQADIEFAQHRYDGKRCFYQCRFDLSGSPCNKWIIGDRTRVLRHLRNYHHLQTGPAAPSGCLWEKCTHSRAMKQENLSRHVVKHLGVKWRCPHCKQLFSRDDAVHRHIERMAPSMDVTDAEVVPGPRARAINDSELQSAGIA